jgi:hypothetical protein
MMRPRTVTGPSKDSDKPVVRFPVPNKGRVVKGRLLRLSELLPRRWRRVVIQGQHYWLPG